MFDIKDEAGEHFVVMEFFERKALRQIVPLLKTQTALDDALHIAEGLQKAHSKDIERFLGHPVFLELNVKVREKWREDEQWLQRSGYSQ